MTLYQAVDHLAGRPRRLPDPIEWKALGAALSQFAKHLRQAPAMAKDMGASLDILYRAMGRCIETTDSVWATCQ